MLKASAVGATDLYRAGVPRAASAKYALAESARVTKSAAMAQARAPSERTSERHNLSTMLLLLITLSKS
jgi:hypothetical protein